jgi:hypothetical protein
VEEHLAVGVYQEVVVFLAVEGYQEVEECLVEVEEEVVLNHLEVVVGEEGEVV